MCVFLLMIPLLLSPVAAFAQDVPSAACVEDLNAVDASFVETQQHLEAGFKGDKAAKCEAVAHHIAVMQNGIDVYMRCMPDDYGRRENVGQLGASIEDFHYIADQLGC